MAGNAIDLVTLDDVKLWMGKDGGTVHAVDDPNIEKTITAASKFLLNEMNRGQIKTATKTDYFDGTGGCEYVPRLWPIIAVTSVQVDATVIAQAADHLKAGWFFFQDSGEVDRIRLNGFRFTWGQNNCKIVYSYGFADIPEDIAQACKELVALRIRDRKRIGVVSENLGAGQIVTYSQKDMNDFCREIVENYIIRS